MTASLEPPTTAPAGSELPAWVLPLAQLLEQRLSTLYGAGRDPLLAELITLLSAALSRGLLDLPLTGPPPPGVTAAPWPGGHRRALEASPLARDPDGPLVLEGDRLGWRRWQRQRQSVLQDLVARVGAPPLVAEPAALAPVAALLAGLDSQQGLAVQTVLRQGLVLLEGGPGTGKTSTVAAMVAALRVLQPEARVHLAAPTGKAAARLRAAVADGTPCSTLHRLLESRGSGFARHRERPLALDLLVVDEVSMVDLGLMEALLAALPPQARLVLVGDPAQLPPVAPGAVLLELQQPQWRQALGPACIRLSTTYRNQGQLAQLAAVLRQQIQEPQPPATDGDALARLRPLLQALAPADNLQWQEASPRQLPTVVLERLRQRQQQLATLAARLDPTDVAQPAGDGADPAAIAALVEARDGLLLLVPQRQGRWGLEAIHQALLGDAAARGPEGWPQGTPVLCSRNLPELGLANGDLGVLLGSPQRPQQRRVLFGGAEAPITIHPAQLAGAVEPAHALTVHKAQGSEAQEVMVLLPPGRPLDPRLLYTALTRARRQALLISAREATTKADQPSSPAFV